MIRASGAEPEVIEYLKTPPNREKLVELISKMRISPRQLMREKGTPYAELGLNDLSFSEDALIDAMMQHPILINRPIVVTAKGVKLCRPSELVLTIFRKPSHWHIYQKRWRSDPSHLKALRYNLAFEVL